MFDKIHLSMRLSATVNAKGEGLTLLSTQPLSVPRWKALLQTKS